MTTATRAVRVLKPASAVVHRERLGDGSELFNVHVSDGHSDERSAVFNADTQEHAVRLARAIEECRGWTIR